MEFVRIRLGAFGGLTDLDTGPDPLGRLVAVLGPNEAGKTTLFNFLTAMLYGIYPASRERNPYAPWSGGDIDGGASLRLEDGEVWEVQRRLLSSPSGTLTRGTITEEIRNRTLPCAEHVPREVFRQVYALTLADLAGLEGEGWAKIQDQLITGMGTKDIASVRATIEDLRRDAGRIWRPSRVGNQSVRDLRERIRDLRLRRRVAADVDRDLRAAAAEKADVEARLRVARDELEACRLFVEGCQRLLPLRDRLHRIESLYLIAGPDDELDGMPPHPGKRLEELRSAATRLEGRLGELTEEAREPKSRIEAFGPEHRDLLDRSREIRETITRASGIEASRVRAHQLDNEIRHLDRRCEDIAREVLDGPWRSVDHDAVRTVPVAALRRALERHRAADELRRETSTTREGPTDRRWAVGAAAVGLVAIILAMALGRVYLALPGALLLGVGGALIAVRGGRSTRAPGIAGGRDPKELEADRRAAGEEISRIIGGIPVRPELVMRPSADLAVSLERLQHLLSDMDERYSERQDIGGRIESIDAEIRKLASGLGGGPSEVAIAVRSLEDGLREADSRRDAAASAGRELDRIERERRVLAEELTTVEGDRAHLEGRLSRIAGTGNERTPVEVVRERLEALDLARRLESELQREYPDRSGLVERIEAFESVHSDRGVEATELASMKVREAELDATVGDLSKRLEGLKKDMEYLGREETMGAIDGEIEALRAEMDAQIRERDRLSVIATVLREADRRFRENHQPDVLRRAGCHLSTVTGGRYERILLDEADGGRFLLDGPGYPGPIEVGEPISTGTREQVYLSLRLAILDHLDRWGERLPLFLDEAFVNWDKARRTRALGLIRDVARVRQVFVFTCHDEMAGTLGALGARVLVLDPRE